MKRPSCSNVLKGGLPYCGLAKLTLTNIIKGRTKKQRKTPKGNTNNRYFFMVESVYAWLHAVLIDFVCLKLIKGACNTLLFFYGYNRT